MKTATKPSIHRCFKGGLYKVVGTVKYSEAEEELIVYRALCGDCGLWARPTAMFMGMVEIGDEPPPCFSPINTS